MQSSAPHTTHHSCTCTSTKPTRAARCSTSAAGAGTCRPNRLNPATRAPASHVTTHKTTTKSSLPRRERYRLASHLMFSGSPMGSMLYTPGTWVAGPVGTSSLSLPRSDRCLPCLCDRRDSLPCLRDRLCLCDRLRFFFDRESSLDTSLPLSSLLLTPLPRRSRRTPSPRPFPRSASPSAEAAATGGSTTSTTPSAVDGLND